MNSNQDKSNKNTNSKHKNQFLLITTFSLMLSACISDSPYKTSPPSPTHQPNKNTHQNQSGYPYQANYICQQPEHYSGQVIGDGHCVSFIKFCANAPQTRLWSPGKKVLSLPQGSIKPGSIIATFKNGIYPSVSGYHAAIYIDHDERGIWVWDQWLGKPVHKRLIRTRYDNATASNTAQAYRLVE